MPALFCDTVPRNVRKKNFDSFSAMNGIPSFSLFTASSNKFHKFCIVFLSTCMNEGNDRAQYGVFEDLDTEYF